MVGITRSKVIFLQGVENANDGSSLRDSTRRKVQGLWVTKTYSVLLENFLTKNLTQVPDSPVVRARQTSKQRLHHGFAVPQVELSDLLVCSSYVIHIDINTYNIRTDHIIYI